MTTNPLALYDWKFADFVNRTRELVSQGFRPLSISQYGDPAEPLFAAVWDKRTGPALRWDLGYTVTDFLTEYRKNRNEGFYPTHVTATGGGSSTRMSGFFEQREPTELTVGQDLAAFRAEVRVRAKNGWIPRSATMYDDHLHQPLVAAVWERNTANVAWTATAGLTPDEHQARFDAHWSQWARLTFATGSTRGSLLAVYRDDQIGPIGQGFVARHGLTRAAFEKEQTEWLEKGLYVVCLQGYGPDSDRRYTAIFVTGEQPVKRVLRTAGSAAVPAIDQAVTDLMKASNIRGASLAIAQGTRLVFARAYTWAEPDYPLVEPATGFRLASCSKLVTALGVHQLAAEGELDLGARLPEILPLTTPDGQIPTSAAYRETTVRGLLEYGGRFQRYEGEGPAVAAAFHTPLPVTHEQIASYMTTRDPLPAPSDRLDDTGYFMAGQIIKRLRGTTTLMKAIAAGITGPLGITRLHPARSLVGQQPAGEARHHSRDLELHPSVMTPQRPLVPREYGDENLETMETSGGLSAAAPDLVRLLAAMNAKPYTPLGRPVVDRLLTAAGDTGGHGFDFLHLFDVPKKLYRGPKGGLLQTSQSGLWFTGDGFSYVILWNGLHTGGDLTLDDGDGPGWYPEFTKVLQAAEAHPWPKTDLFPGFGMPSLPVTEAGWRRCRKCQGLFAAAAPCPAGGTHISVDPGQYVLMRDSEFSYGQRGWRSCARCRSLVFGGNGKGVCAAGGPHDLAGGHDYTLVHDSPYREHQTNWRWCRKCESLHLADTPAPCPAGGNHDTTGSGDYSLATA